MLANGAARRLQSLGRNKRLSARALPLLRSALRWWQSCRGSSSEWGAPWCQHEALGAKWLAFARSRIGEWPVRRGRREGRTALEFRGRLC